jgi:hypothetical protein
MRKPKKAMEDASNSSYVTLGSTWAPKQYECIGAIICKYVEHNHPQNCSIASRGA